MLGLFFVRSQSVEGTSALNRRFARLIAPQLSNVS
jgi:hypothetical protein